MVTDNPERMDQMGALLGPHFPELGAELWPDVPVVADLEEDVPPSA